MTEGLSENRWYEHRLAISLAGRKARQVEPHIQVDRRFAIIDEWVLDLEVSDRAIRLYAILVRYADKDTHKAFPSRKTLAKRLRCSTKSVDRAIQELIDARLLSKEQRFNSSLIFTLHTVSPPVSRGVDSGDHGGWTQESRGVDTRVDLTITTELEPLEPKPLNDIGSKFDEFWNLYPKKQGRGAAYKALEKALNRERWETILDGVQRFANDPNLPEKQFIPLASTWLNQDRWTDEPYSAPAMPQKPLTNNQHAALLAQQYRQKAQIAEIEAIGNPQQAKAIEAELSSWFKGVDDV